MLGSTSCATSRIPVLARVDHQPHPVMKIDTSKSGSSTREPHSECRNCHKLQIIAYQWLVLSVAIATSLSKLTSVLYSIMFSSHSKLRQLSERAPLEICGFAKHVFAEKGGRGLVAQPLT
jgi:hypothetical protein